MLQVDGPSFFSGHGACPTCGRCLCCGQDQFSFPGWNVSTTHVDLPDDLDSLTSMDKLMHLIGRVRGDSSFPLDRNTVEDIINGQTKTE